MRKHSLVQNFTEYQLAKDMDNYGKNMGQQKKIKMSKKGQTLKMCLKEVLKDLEPFHSVKNSRKKCLPRDIETRKASKTTKKTSCSYIGNHTCTQEPVLINRPDKGTSSVRKFQHLKTSKPNEENTYCQILSTKDENPTDQLPQIHLKFKQLLQNYCKGIIQKNKQIKILKRQNRNLKEQLRPKREHTKI